jgi:putative ABC transport system permease protein
MALGATPGNILGKVVGHGMRLTAVGILPGLAGAFGLHSVLASALVDVGSFEWGPVLEAAVLLVAVAALAAYLPARRATRIHPAAILRND